MKLSFLILIIKCHGLYYMKCKRGQLLNNSSLTHFRHHPASQSVKNLPTELQEETWVLYAHPGKYLPFSISTSMTTKSGPPRSSLSPSTDPRLRFAFRVSRQFHIKRETTGASPFQEQRQHLPRVLERIQSLIQVPCVISSPYLHGTSVQGNGRI